VSEDYGSLIRKKNNLRRQGPCSQLVTGKWMDRKPRRAAGAPGCRPGGLVVILELVGSFFRYLCGRLRVHISYTIWTHFQLINDLGYTPDSYKLVMGGFGSEPRFEPEPVRTEPKFSPGFESSQEPNLRFSSWFSSPLNFLNAFELEPSTIIVITNI
jgi:hypothetical protein